MKRKISSNYLDTVFVPSNELQWNRGKDGLVVVDITHRGFFPKIAQTFFHKPKVSHISLDSYGSALWESLDGKRNVWDVILHMKTRFPDEEERMTDRVITFMHTLQIRHFILPTKQTKGRISNENK